MKFLKYLLVAALALFCAGQSKAQCSISYSLGYTVSNSSSYDPVNKILYTAVKSEGSASMALNVQGTCPDSFRTSVQNAINTATHALQIPGSLQGASPVTSKTANGPTLCAACYNSAENDLQIYNPVIGQSYNWTYGSSVLCSVGGLMNFFATIHLYTETAFTEAKATGAPSCIGILGAKVCTQPVVPWCTPQTSPPDFQPYKVVYGTTAPFLSGYTLGFAVCNRSALTGRWYCPAPGVTIGSYEPDPLANPFTGQYPLQPCTHTP